MGTTTEDLFQEILGNIRKDRVSVERMRDTLMGSAASLGSDDEEDVQQPPALPEIAENVAKLSDVLTKMNSQLVELAKMKAKSEGLEDDGLFDSDEVYAEIESTEPT